MTQRCFAERKPAEPKAMSEVIDESVARSLQRPSRFYGLSLHLAPFQA